MYDRLLKRTATTPKTFNKKKAHTPNRAIPTASQDNNKTGDRASAQHAQKRSRQPEGPNETKIVTSGGNKVPGWSWGIQPEDERQKRDHCTLAKILRNPYNEDAKRTRVTEKVARGILPSGENKQAKEISRRRLVSKARKETAVKHQSCKHVSYLAS